MITTIDIGKETFLANMSHEIRAPLAVIRGVADYLMTDGMVVEQHRAWLEVMLRNVDHLSCLVEDMLALSTIELGKLALNLKSVALLPLVKEVVLSFGNAAGIKGLVLSAAADGPIPETIITDGTRLRQILVNVLGNAIKFTDAGTISVHCKHVPPYVVILTSDTGKGLTEAQSLNIFRPFAQGDNATACSYGGSGLGLALSRQLAIALGGTVELVESTPGVGSTFMIKVATGNLDDTSLTDVCSCSADLTKCG